MDSMGNKKLALLYVLKILQRNSDCDHPMTQSEIADCLDNEYGIVLERKAVSRNISLLREAGYEIETTAKGVYLDEREFDDTELRMIIDGVLSSRYISKKQSKDIADRLCSLSNRYFRSCVKHISVLSENEKTLNNAVFYNVGIIDEAIEANYQVSFNYYKFDEILRLSFDQRVTLSPVQMIVKNQFYYLIGVEEYQAKSKTVYYLKTYRMDMIVNPIIEDVNRINPDKCVGYEKGFSLNSFLKAHPYMNSKYGAKKSEFLCYETDLDLVIENLGTDITVKKIKPIECKDKVNPSVGLVKVILNIEPEELIEFACRYPQKIFIVSPETAKHRHKQLLEGALNIYEMVVGYDC